MPQQQIDMGLVDAAVAIPGESLQQFGQQFGQPQQPQQPNITPQFGGPQQQPQPQQQLNLQDPGTFQPPAASVDMDLVNAAVGQKPEEIDLAQRVALSLIREEPELQVKALQNRGYEAKIENDNLVFKAPGERMFRPFTESFSESAIQYAPEVVEAVISAIGTGSKVVNPLAGAAIGGAGAGGVELAKQAAAAALGLREDVNLGRVGEQAALGATLPAAFKGLTSAIKPAGKFLAGKIGAPTAGKVAKTSEEVAEIKGAFKEIGTVPTAGAISSDPTIRAIEGILTQLKATPAGMFTRARRANIDDAARATAEGIAARGGGRTAFESGEAFKTDAMKAINERLKKAEELYSIFETKLGPAKISARFAPGEGVRKFNQTLDALADKHKFADDALKLIGNVRAKLDKVETISDLRALRTHVRKGLKTNASSEARHASSLIYDELTEFRNDQVKRLVNISKTFLGDAEEALGGRAAAERALKEADKIYKSVAQDVEKALLAPGQKSKFSPRRTAREALAKVKGEDVAAKFLPSGDIGKVKAVKKLTQTGFDELKARRVTEAVERSISKAKGGEGLISPHRLGQIISKEFTPEVAKEVFGKNGVQKAKALEVIYENLPGQFNSSQSGVLNQIMGQSTSIINHLKGASLSAIQEFMLFKGNITTAPLFVALSAKLDAEELRLSRRKKDKK